MKEPANRQGYVWVKIESCIEQKPTTRYNGFRECRFLDVIEFVRYMEVEAPRRFATAPPKRIAKLRPFGVTPCPQKPAS